MVRNVFNIEIHKPVEEVFSYVDDDAKLRLWIDGILESSPAPRPPVPGATFRQVVDVRGKRMELHGELLRYEPNRELAVRLKSSLCDMDVTYRFEPLASSTRVRYVCDAWYHRWYFRLLGPLLKRAAQQKLEKDFNKLKRLVEGAEASAPTRETWPTMKPA